MRTSALSNALAAIGIMGVCVTAGCADTSMPPTPPNACKASHTSAQATVARFTGLDPDKIRPISDLKRPKGVEVPDCYTFEVPLKAKPGRHITLADDPHRPGEKAPAVNGHLYRAKAWVDESTGMLVRYDTDAFAIHVHRDEPNSKEEDVMPASKIREMGLDALRRAALPVDEMRCKFSVLRGPRMDNNLYTYLVGWAKIAAVDSYPVELPEAATLEMDAITGQVYMLYYSRKSFDVPLSGPVLPKEQALRVGRAALGEANDTSPIDCDLFVSDAGGVVAPSLMWRVSLGMNGGTVWLDGHTGSVVRKLPQQPK